MKNILVTIGQVGGVVLIFAGLVMAAGSGGDCDGKCMEYANTLGEMLVLVLGGVILMGVGAVMTLVSSSFKQ